MKNEKLDSEAVFNKGVTEIFWRTCVVEDFKMLQRRANKDRFVFVSAGVGLAIAQLIHIFVWHT